MSDSELITMMRQAKDPYAQVQICADLCGCTRAEMENRLLDLGVDFPKKRGRKPGPKPVENPVVDKTATKAKEPETVVLQKVEAGALYNHLMLSILDEIKADPEGYDNIDYLVNLVHIYERCKEVAKC